MQKIPPRYRFTPKALRCGAAFGVGEFCDKRRGEPVGVSRTDRRAVFARRTVGRADWASSAIAKAFNVKSRPSVRYRTVHRAIGIGDCGINNHFAQASGWNLPRNLRGAESAIGWPVTGWSKVNSAACKQRRSCRRPAAYSVSPRMGNHMFSGMDANLVSFSRSAGYRTRSFPLLDGRQFRRQ